MSVAFPEPTDVRESRAAVFLGYLDYFRDRLVAKLRELPAEDLTHSRLPSGWTPLQLLNHLTYVELRWLEWGFEGADVAQPWGDEHDGRWQVGTQDTLDTLTAALDERAQISRTIIERHELDELGQPGPRWEGVAPPTLERILFHLLQEYARHLGQLDVVAELAGGAVGE